MFDPDLRLVLQNEVVIALETLVEGLGALTPCKVLGVLMP
jgi:hypothetical protein